MTKPTKWSVRSAKMPGHLHEETLRPLTTYWAHSADSDQTGWMPRLIWVFAGRTSFCWFCHAAAHITIILSENSRQDFATRNEVSLTTTVMKKWDASSLNLGLNVNNTEADQPVALCSLFGVAYYYCHRQNPKPLRLGWLDWVLKIHFPFYNSQESVIITFNIQSSAP